MNKTKNKKEYNLLHIVMGLAIGFFMGSVLVYFSFNRQNVSFLGKNLEYLAESGHPGEKNISENNENKVNKEYIEQPVDSSAIVDLSSNDAGSTDTNASQYQKKTGIKNVISEKNDPDTKNISFDNYHIKKDELIHKRVIFNPLIKKKYHGTTYPDLDSILGRGETAQSKDFLFIEFWETPLNSKGYIKGKNKILLYGISLHDFVTFIYHDEIIYLKYLNQYYPLEVTPEFKHLKPLSDLALIDQLQQF